MVFINHGDRRTKVYGLIVVVQSEDAKRIVYVYSASRIIFRFKKKCDTTVNTHRKEKEREKYLKIKEGRNKYDSREKEEENMCQ